MGAAATHEECPAPVDVPASEMSAALAEIVARRTAEMKAGVEADFAQWLAARQSGRLAGDCLLRTMYETPGLLSAPVDGDGHGDSKAAPAMDKVVKHGRLEYRPGFESVWLGGTLYDLSERTKARLCIQYLVEQNAFDADSARHLTDEIDPYVRRGAGDLPPSADIRIDHYFNDEKGKLPRLRKELIVAAGRKGRFFLKTD